MISASRKTWAVYSLIIPWMLSWILVLPFFHIHALDIQEDLSRSQAFLPHTLYSPDLPGEYSVQTGVDGHALSSHTLKYSELAIGLFSEDDDTKRKIGTPLDRSSALDAIELQFDRFRISEFPSHPSILLASSLSSRAPPFI
jgi:hypothetical protein